MQLEAEHRAIVQGSMAAKRAGKLEGGSRRGGGSELLTALVVLVVVIGTLVLVMRYAN